MIVRHLLDKICENKHKQAIVWQGVSYNYRHIHELIVKYVDDIKINNINPGAVVAIVGDYSPNTIAFFIALLVQDCIVVPLTKRSPSILSEYFNITQVEHSAECNEDGRLFIRNHNRSVDNLMLLKFKQRKHPGLVILSSGSTGKSKAVLHDMLPLLEKFKTQKRCLRVISFLLFDHIGGINTLFYTLFNGGCIVIPVDRSPNSVADAIHNHKVAALTTTPTFLNLLLISGVLQKYNFDSLQVINYGTEIMPEIILKQLHQLLPNVALSQAYGLSEVGVIPIRSKSSTSTMIKMIENDRCQIRIRDGLLEIKTKSSMIGYLNSDSPITEDGWFKTGDAVEVHGEYIKILGRQSDLINVGGVKVYPAEIENVIRQMDGVEDISVYSRQNIITGSMVAASIRLSKNEELSSFQSRMHKFCKEKLASYKIPQKILLTTNVLYSDRFKKIRKQSEGVL